MSFPGDGCWWPTRSRQPSAAARRLKDPDKIGIRVGKVINKHKVGKHFITEVTGTSLTWRRDEEKIAAEGALDGIYVIRTSVTAGILDAAGAVTAYKDLKYVERDFRITKADDLDPRPVYHYLDRQVPGHVLICMLACYLTWHLRQALAELTYTDQHIPASADPVAPAQRSAQARAKDAAKHTPAGLPACRYRDLLGHLSTLDRQTISFAGQKIQKLTRPTPPRPAPSSCSAPPSRWSSSSNSTRRIQILAGGITPVSTPPPAPRSRKFGLTQDPLHDSVAVSM